MKSLEVGKDATVWPLDPPHVGCITLFFLDSTKTGEVQRTQRNRREEEDRSLFLMQELRGNLKMKMRDGGMKGNIGEKMKRSGSCRS
jgi:hypothetical protein